MKIAEVKVAKTTCETTPLMPIPRGIVGAVVSIEYTDPAWDDLQKTVVFRSAVTKDVLAAGNEVVVPAEVVSRAGMNLYMGVYGVNAANNVVIPTIWTDLGMIRSAAAPSGDTSSDPSLPVWAQIQGMIGNLEDLDTEAKNNLVTAVNEAMTKGGSAVSSVNGKTGAVVLTAGDVHAMPDNTVIPTVPKKVSAFENDSGYLTEHQDISGKVDKVEGMGLSTNDYDNAAKAKVDAIPENPKYTDTVYDDTEVIENINQLKDDISNLRFGDPYDGVDLTSKFAEEISGYSDPGAWIRARIQANNFDGIHVNDYIPFTTTNGLKFKSRVAGIDPYYEYGDSAVGHHIDFVCEELWPTLHPINPGNYNNGLIPTENVTSDGSSTQYVLAKPMYGVAKVTISGTDLTGWTYDKDTYTLTFSTAPAAGTMVVTGTGSEYPWLSCDAYLYANSLAGHVPNGTGLNPAIKRVDYTNDGIYHYLPDWLKSVIIDKRVLLGKRYSTSGVLSNENGLGWVNLGKLWFPAEMEVYGCPVWGSNGGYGLGGSIQYPLFMGNMRRVKKRNGSRNYWWLLSPHTNAAYWCSVTSDGNALYYNASADWVAAPVCFRIG